jgi:predicted ribosome-associated RNA-binding protein Tma20
VQFTDASAAEAVVLCFRGSSTQTTTNLVLNRLDPARAYAVTLVDQGSTSAASGRDLMDRGIYLALPEAGASEIVLITAQGQPA